MGQDSICQFYIIVGDREFNPFDRVIVENNKFNSFAENDVFINATGVLDDKLIETGVYREFNKISKLNKESSSNIKINNEIIFLIPSMEFEPRCYEIMSSLRIRGKIEYVMKKEEIKKLDNVNKVESNLNSDRNISASGSQNIEIQKDTGIEKITISDNKAYLNNGLLSIDEQKKILLQEWQKDPYMSVRLSSLSPEEIDRMLMESVTKNLTAYRMESSREQNANDKVGEIAKDKAKEEDGLVNTELGIVRNNVSNSNQYSTVEKNGNNIYVANPNVTSATINSSGVSSNSSSNYSNWDANIVVNDEQEREVLGEFYFDDDYNVYDNKGDVIGKNGQDGIWMSYDSNTGVSKLVVNGKIMGYIDHIKNMSVKKSNNHVLTKKKSEYRSAAFVSLPVIMFVLSAMLLVGSVILLFVLK